MSEHDYDPEWEQLVDMLRGFGPRSRFIAVGMEDGKPGKKFEVHKVELGSHKYLDNAKWRLTREEPKDRYAHFFAGVRVFWHPERGGVYLPYPPERKERDE